MGGGLWCCERNHRRRLDEEAKFKHLDQVVRNLQGIDGIRSFGILLFRNGRSRQDNQSGSLANRVSSLHGASILLVFCSSRFPCSSIMMEPWHLGSAGGAEATDP